MIIASAIRQKGIIFIGKRHHNCIKTIVEVLGEKPVTGEQGFVCDEGNFWNRQEAFVHAVNCGQIEPTGNHKDGMLFSEDLY